MIEIPLGISPDFDFFFAIQCAEFCSLHLVKSMVVVFQIESWARPSSLLMFPLGHRMQAG